MRTLPIIGLYAALWITLSCEVDNPVPDPGEYPEYADWSIPKNEIIRRGMENDFISSIDNPDFVHANAVDFLQMNDLVIGLNIKGDYRAYPVRILNYHEVVNDHFAAGETMISYCPLSGSCAAWDNTIQGFSTTFGVSRFIYNSHHVLYDRTSGGHWLPLTKECVNGELEGYTYEGYSAVQVTWSKWSSMFPGSKVLAIPNDTVNDYSIDPYKAYKDNDTLLYPVNPENSLLARKEKVHGIVVDKRLKAYIFQNFGDTTTLIHDNFQGMSVILAGSRSGGFIVSFERRYPDGKEPDFTPVNDTPNIIMQDDEGNRYDIFGVVVDGPRKGQVLKPANSVSGYWHVVSSIFPDPVLY